MAPGGGEIAPPTSGVVEDLTDEECALIAILLDQSGVDAAEFCWYDDETNQPWRAWPFQWSWWRDDSPLVIDQCARAVGKTTSIILRMFAFPFSHPGQEAAVTAPELVHLQPLTRLIERQFRSNRLGREMLPTTKGRVTQRPFEADMANGSRIVGRIPQRDGRGVNGCLGASEPVLTSTGYKPANQVQVGDLILTDRLHWRPVTAVIHDVNDCYEVSGQGSHPMVVSCDHRFFGAMNLATPKQKRRFEPLRWHDVEFLLEHQVYWATPTVFPALPVPALRVEGTATPIDAPQFWWLVGRYLADGVLPGNGRAAHFTCRGTEDGALQHVAAELGLHFERIHRPHGHDVFALSSRAVAEWLAEHCGRGSANKTLPAFALGLRVDQRQALLDGYLAGDGHFSPAQKRWEASSSSRDLVMGLQLLAQSLGFTVNTSRSKAEEPISWRIQMSTKGVRSRLDDYLVGKVKKVVPVGKQPIVNLVVDGDHSYLSGTIMSHNIHPLLLEMDEASLYPKEGWTELIETLKRGHEGARWRAHGVTRGFRDKFFELTQPSADNHWKVHRIAAMWRPTWSDVERQEKIQAYGGSRDTPDYRRNILGLHGDATAPIFIPARLMQCVDENAESDYNTDEYVYLRVNHELLNDRGVVRDVIEFLDFPESHRHDYRNVWIGMDVGLAKDPSEILVFAEENVKGLAGPRLKLITRVHLERVSNPQQARAIAWMMDFYKPRCFALDKTGIGLPLFQDLQEVAPAVAARIKGYNFSEKVLVDFDEAVVADLKEYEDDVKEAGIFKRVLEYSTDVLRDLVDHKQLLLPWDKEVLSEFQGQTMSYDKSRMDVYGRPTRVYSNGSFHTLDAARMAALGWKQEKIEQMMAARRQTDESPVIDVFVSPY